MKVVKPDPSHDVKFGQLCRLLMENKLLMVTNLKGGSTLYHRDPSKPLHPAIRNKKS